MGDPMVFDENAVIKGHDGFMWCAWCRVRPFEGQLITVDTGTGKVVNKNTVLLCEKCGDHFDGGQAKMRPGYCYYSYVLFEED